jgi:hypothetical protein
MHHQLRSFAAAAILFPICNAFTNAPELASQGDPTRSTPAAVTPAADPFVLPAGDLELADVVARASAYLGCNVLIQKGALPDAGKAPLTLQRGLKTDRAGCEEFLATALAHYGMTLTYVDSKQTTMEALHPKAANAERALQRATPRTVDEVLARPDLAMPATVVVDVAHCNLGEALSAMQPFVARGKGIGIGLTVGQLGDSKRLLMVGLQTEIAQALAVLRAVDRPEAATEALRRERDREVEQLQRRIDGVERMLKAANKPADGK